MSLEFISNEHMLFPTPLWQVQIKGVDNDAIKKYVYNLRDTTKGVVISNRGGWHSKDILEPIPEALENLFSNFQSFVNQYCAQITGLNQLKIGNFWFNINSKYDYNRTHDHQNSILSAVYYIDAKETISVRLSPKEMIRQNFFLVLTKIYLHLHRQVFQLFL